jgi:hypothetical protein
VRLPSFPLSSPGVAGLDGLDGLDGLTGLTELTGLPGLADADDEPTLTEDAFAPDPFATDRFGQRKLPTDDRRKYRQRP